MASLRYLALEKGVASRYVEPILRPLCHELVDRFAARREVDLVAEFTKGFPLTVIARDRNASGESRLPDGADPDVQRWQSMFSAVGDLLRAGGAGGAALFEPALRLLGLGPGLTPAGDDFVGGMLFALNRVARAYPEKVHRATPGRTVLLDKAQAATTRISFTILSDLAHGHGPEPMHTLVLALVHGEELAQAVGAAEAITRIGHTSGWDLLAGMLSGLSLLVGQAGRG